MLTWLEISKKNLLFNIRQLRKVAGRKTKLLAVVKANAYGHGVKDVAKVIKNKVDWFGVANVYEALLLRDQKIKNPILVLSYYENEPYRLTQAVERKISLVVYTEAQIELLASIAKKLQKKALVHLKIDSGASRIGVLPKEIKKYLSVISKHKNIILQGVFSHFADAEANIAYTKKQLAIFENVLKIIQKSHPRVLPHIACSAASVLLPDSRLTLARSGIMVYGLHPSKKTDHSPSRKDYIGRHISLKPVLTWKTRIIQIKQLPKNTPIGYGLSYRTKRATKMAVLPVGYADGYDRKLSNKGAVLVSGRRAKVIGRICMNLMMVDITGIKSKTGNEVVLLGKQGSTEVTAQELAKKIGTINYEVVTRINWVMPRIIV